MGQKQHRERRGTIAILAAFLTIVLLGMVAFCVDIGYIYTAKEEMQRTADATAMAACWDFMEYVSEGNTEADASLMASSTANAYAAANVVTNNPSYLTANASNNPSGDVVFGYVSDLAGAANAFDTSDPSLYNAVRVRVRKDSSINGEVPYFFARIFGLQGQALRAEATAAMVNNVKGFRTPADGSNIDLLPFVIDLETWNNWMAGIGDDAWTWDESCGGQVVAGPDGKIELDLYPQGSGSPGNRGTVDIGSSSNSTYDIARQIVDGVSPSDLGFHGGTLELNSSGELSLNGDPGISAGVKDELVSIQGQPRIVPVFAQVVGPGNNAQYTIVKWFGVRVMDVRLTGPMSQKHVLVQAAPIVVRGVIPSSTTGTSSYVYSGVALVQ